MLHRDAVPPPPINRQLIPQGAAESIPRWAPADVYQGEDLGAQRLGGTTAMSCAAAPEPNETLH